MNWLILLLKRLSGLAPELPSPRDLVKQSDIHYDQAKRTITIFNIKPNIWLTSVQDTNSMDATMDAGHTCILTANFKPEDLVVGDIAVYKRGSRSIIHRIVKIENDTLGRKFIFRGDNCFYCDAPVRDNQLKWLLLGILY